VIGSKAGGEVTTAWAGCRPKHDHSCEKNIGFPSKRGIQGRSIFRQHVFKDWDQGLANENFPRHTGGAVVLDGIGFVEKYMAEKPEEFLEYSDWMGIPIQPYPISHERIEQDFRAYLSHQSAPYYVTDFVRKNQKHIDELHIPLFKARSCLPLRAK
jgi:hypothetical protein